MTAAAEMDAPESGEVAEREWPTAAQRARESLGRPRPLLPSGIGSLDVMLAGGFPAGMLAVVAGAPGAGKTSWIVDCCSRWAAAGIPVLFVALDESADSILVRVGQARCGLHRRDLDGTHGAEAARESAEVLAEWCDAHPGFELVDPAAEGVVIDEAIDAWAERTGRCGVVIIDSVQAAAFALDADGEDGPEGTRGRVDAVLSSLRYAASSGHLVIGVSEVARTFYRSRNPREQSDPLAAAKESGRIEYSADLLVVLRSVEGRDDLVDATVAKNRRGKRGSFALRRDEERCAFADAGETGESNEVDTAAEEAKEAGKRNAIRKAILAEVSKRPGSKSSLASRVRGRRALVLDVIDELESERVIERVGKQFRRAEGR